MNDTVLVQEQDGILEVVLNRPQKYNAISDEMLEMLRETVDRFGARRDLRVMLIRAAGPYFTAGMDVNPELSPSVAGSTLDGRHWYRTKFHRMFDELEAIEKPIVVAHQGPCLGGGLEMSLSCDFRLAAASARYGLPEIDIGALPGSGGISRLTRIAGPHWARWLVMAGEQVDAAQALSMGIVHAVYPDEEFESRVRAFCAKLTRQPYELLGLAKLSIELATDLDRAQARNVERISNSILFTGAEHKALLQAFLDRQAAKRKARDGSA
ncbi:MAG: Enoyl-CoA hydratase/carnithine racemase [Hydrocarboniphaga sp.]|uniref:enoyl-CoA hydratase/isomerase family protein n=1 Tax=Hydrocarboniphaga sp. TaxID=2033016 RepID=UPI00260AAAB2|nr:enoyl-CoA hydratase/isomerase family protein [Hydrocarboniphaga sp.]MDB5968404.1 Enoyl-CoA hydratase/carnithine racemase [Hydrocarboniphaga sp.]